jgi:DNA-binding LacI/PurR family transcriptional regulator
MKSNQITIKDLARKLNISTSTVSRALRGVPEVNPETKRAVEELAARLQYEPNLVAKSLVKKKTNTIGVVIPEIVDHFFSSVIKGVQEVAQLAGYHVVICTSGESMEKERRNIQTLVSSRVDGLLVSLSKETSSFTHLSQLTEKGIPLVLFDRVCAEVLCSKVVVTDYEGAFQATQHLIRMGCRRIAHLAGPQQLLIGQHRLQGYIDALRQHHLPVEASLIRYENLDASSGIASTQALLALPELPDAVFAFTDSVALGALFALRQAGLSVPDDVSLAGFTDETCCSLIEPSLTTVRQPSYEMGKVAAHLLLAQILYDIQSYVPETITLETKLIIRNSSKKQKSWA